MADIDVGNIDQIASESLINHELADLLGNVHSLVHIKGDGKAVDQRIDLCVAVIAVVVCGACFEYLIQEPLRITGRKSLPVRKYKLEVPPPATVEYE